MAKNTPMPNQREAIILSILVRGEKYGREVRTDYETRTKQAMPLGSLYVTLDRMEEKGFVASRMGESDPGRGGNRRKYFKLTASGFASLNAVQQMFSVPRRGMANV